MLQLETITDTLVRGYKQLEPNTFQTSAELTTERRTNEDLRNRLIYTANLGLYEHTYPGKLRFGIGGRKTFNAIAGEDIDHFCEELIRNKDYYLTAEQRAILKSLESDIVWVDPAALRLIKLSEEYNYFEIDTSYPKRLNPHQRVYAELCYGKGDDFERNIRMFNREGIQVVRVHVLNTEDYVRKHVSKGEVVARACWLGGFSDNSNFYAVLRVVDNNFSLRGVLKVTEGDIAQNLVTLPEDELHAVLEQYIPSVDLEQAKGEISDIYHRND